MRRESWYAGGASEARGLDAERDRRARSPAERAGYPRVRGPDPESRDRMPASRYDADERDRRGHPRGRFGYRPGREALEPEERGEMDESTSPVRLPEAAARRFGHVCGFFHSKEEEYRVLLPLAKEGFQ